MHEFKYLWERFFQNINDGKQDKMSLELERIVQTLKLETEKKKMKKSLRKQIKIVSGFTHYQQVNDHRIPFDKTPFLANFIQKIREARTCNKTPH